MPAATVADWYKTSPFALTAPQTPGLINTTALPQVAPPTTAPGVATVDVGGYRLEAREVLIKKAHEAAEKVRRWGDVVELEPLSAFDRRIVHHALKDDPDITTQSVEVDGTNKKAMLLRLRES